MGLSSFIVGSENVFAIRNLPEETISYLLARYSRSNKSLRETLAEAIADGSIQDEPDWYAVSQFLPEDMQQELRAWTAARNQPAPQAKALHEKFVLGYGHSSVAEGSIVHLGVEGCSFLAAKAIQDCRLASYTEKSTRYVEWGENSVLPGLPFKSTAGLLAAYHTLLPQAIKLYEGSKPRAFDLLRGLLPCCGLTSLGITINARELRRLVNKLAHHPLQECRDLSLQIRQAVETVVPTLLRYVDEPEAPPLTPVLPRYYGGAAVRLRSQPEYMGPWTALFAAYPSEEEFTYLSEYSRPVPEHHPIEGLPRAYEAEDVIFEITCDYGAFRDLQRHRMTTLITKPSIPHPGGGYTIPKDIYKLQGPGLYIDAIDAAIDEAWAHAELGLHAVQYALPLAHQISFLWKMNLREAAYIVKLRSGPAAHPSYQKIAQEMGRLLNIHFPGLCQVHADGGGS